VKVVTRVNSIPIYKLRDINNLESLDFMRALDPEIIISVASPQIFKKEIIDLAK